MSSQTPYWGHIPSAKGAAQAKGRRDLEENEYAQRGSNLHALDTSAAPKANRASTQTAKSTNTDAPTESTMSPFVSPTDSNFASTGLAPRPPSFPYGTIQYPPDLLEKRAKRASRNREEAAKLAAAIPPPAPDVPAGPPVSYRNPHENGAMPDAAATSGPPRSSRRSVATDGEYHKASTPENMKNEYPVLDRSQQTFDAARRPSDGGDQRRRHTQRRGRDSRGPYANDHSPLQRLELTLDSITKEEKRARVEAAERRAREVTQRGQVLQVRFSDRNPLVDPEPKRRVSQNSRPQPGSQETAPVPRSAPNAESVSHRAVVIPPPVLAPAETIRSVGPLSQNPPESGASYSMSRAQQKPRAAPEPKGELVHELKTPGIQRNLSFRERAAARHEMKLPGMEDFLGPMASEEPVPPSGEPVPPPDEPRRNSGFSLIRNGSNKLKKKVPPEEVIPKFKKKVAPEPAQQPQVERRGAPPAHVGSARRALEPPSSPPKTRNSPPRHKETKPEGPIIPPVTNKLTKSPFGSQKRASKDAHAQTVSSISEQSSSQKSLGNKIAPQSTATAAVTAAVGTLTVISGATISVPYEGQYYESARERREEERKDQSSSDSRSSSEGHHLPDRILYAKEKMRPSQRQYMPPRILDEWRKATVGTLEDENLDLSVEDIPVFEKDKAWWEVEGRTRSDSMSNRVKKAEAFEGEYDDANVPSRFKPNLYLKCGPLLRYCGIRTDHGLPRPGRTGTAQRREIWRGTVMIVTRDEDSSYDIVPTLRLFAQPIELLPPPPAEIVGGQALPPEHIDPLVGHTKVGRRGEILYVRPVEHLEESKDVSRYETDEGLFEKIKSPPDYPVEDGSDPPGAFASRRKRIEVDGEKLGKYTEVRGFRLHAERGCTFWRFNIEVELRDKQQRIAYRINRGPATAFWVPDKSSSMNVMFHSCNGFSLSCDSNEFSGPDPMWRDVLNTHQTRPFHVMIGGGDQVYNDCVQNETQLFQEWLMMENIYHKENTPFDADMQDELEEFYLERYCMWFSQGLFSLANSQIPMVNMYDDHDIIDGFGSYPHHFMSSPVFSGLGNVAFKYYLLFQHQSVLDETEAAEPSWIFGVRPGPYINTFSRSLFMMLGSRTALLAVDCRTERSRDEVVTKETWEKIMDRCYAEIEKGKVAHILVLLGVPIAYPRLVWLENILTSRLMDPVKALGKGGLFGNLLNHLDGGVEVLDDLDDHWTAKSHKGERTIVVQDLQDLAADKSTRVTILSGDVHLAAVGQFFSNPKLGLAKHKDFRYIPNVISSAIANTPPPDLLADLLNKRNKTHHFDKDTEENMIPLFQHGVDGKPRNNKHLLPHRNWCSIREYVPGSTPLATPTVDSYEDTPVGTPPSTVRKSYGNGSLLRSLSKRGRTSGSVVERGENSRPPISNSGGLFRSLSRRGSVDAAAPQEASLSPRPKRTLSLTRGNFGGIFGSLRRKKRPEDGGINGIWGHDDDDLYNSFKDERRAREQARQEFRLRRGDYEAQDYDQPRMGIRGGGRSTPPGSGQNNMAYEEGDGNFSTVGPSRIKSWRKPQKHHALGHHHAEPSSPVEMLHQVKMWGDKPMPKMPDEGDTSRWGSLDRASSHRRPPPPHHGDEDVEPEPVQPLIKAKARTEPVPAATMVQAPSDDFVPKPFHRTPTGMSEKQIRKLGGRERVEINLEGGLEVTLNVEVNQKDPSGITVPYKLVVPKLFYEYENEEQERSGKGKSIAGGLGRWLSFRKKRRDDGDGYEENGGGSEWEDVEQPTS